MLLIFLIPILGLLVARAVTVFLPKAQFRGFDVLPFFFIAGCQLITDYKNKPSFLPYGFLLYACLVLFSAIEMAVINKNIDSKKIIKKMWNYLDICSLIWYLGLLVIVLA